MPRWMSLLSKCLLAPCLLALCLTFALPGVALAGVDVNTASSAELQTLPGIGPSKANAIMVYRSENGPFADLGALDAVPGIGPSTLEKVSTLVDFGKGSESLAADLTVQPEAGEPKSEPKSEPAPIAPMGSGVNINVASAAQLESLPGIGAAKAAAIVESRQSQGLFSSCQDLTRVSGIGQATVANMGAGCKAE